MFPVQSSQISYIGYEREDKELFVTFNDGNTYKYLDVPLLIWEEFKNSQSIGKYFISNIKKSYKYENI